MNSAFQVSYIFEGMLRVQNWFYVSDYLQAIKQIVEEYVEQVSTMV